MNTVSNYCVYHRCFRFSWVCQYFSNTRKIFLFYRATWVKYGLKHWCLSIYRSLPTAHIIPLSETYILLALSDTYLYYNQHDEYTDSYFDNDRMAITQLQLH